MTTPSVLLALLQTLGYICNPKMCPITENGGVPICNDFLLRDFDYIIVGGGPAGCALANRLSENSKVNVLLIEAGKYPSRDSEIPQNNINLQKSEEDYAFKVTDPNLFKGYTDQTITLSQGKALGGGTTINAMIHNIGVSEDYRYWAELVDESWSWENLEPYFDKVIQTSKVSTYKADRPVRNSLGLAADELGIKVNDPQSQMGYHDSPVNIIDNTRNSKVKAYLKPIAQQRHNLCVVVERRVNKIVMYNETTAKGIEVQLGTGVATVIAKNEVIVTAGAINSPKILMLSGIGPKEELTNLNISPIYQDLPVGQYLQDQTNCIVCAAYPDITPAIPFNLLLCGYCLTGQFLNTIDITNFLGFFKTKNDLTYPNVEIAHAQIPLKGDIYFNSSDILKPYKDVLRNVISKNSIVIFVPILLHPKSYGKITLKSSNPNDPPNISLNFFSNEEDLLVFVDAIQNYLKPLMATQAFKNSNLIMFDIPECSQYTKDSEDYWKCYVKIFANSSYHVARSCRMGKSRTDSVVNSKLKVWGVDNLRVADSSTIPYLNSGHTTAVTTMIAEVAADLIKSEPKYPKE